MTKDLIYYFDKKDYSQIELGEIQCDFNMSFVIDGTKDSCQVNVWSFVGNEIEPYTIIYHPKTNSWWITTHDKVERYQNESGFMYMHSLELMGAIELLNARDLTDCAFYQNNYTISQLIFRLFNLSNFEMSSSLVIYTMSSVNANEVVDYIKTYENYTLLSALRDFLGGYNITPKLTFVINTTTNKISYPRLLLYSKTGNVNATPISIDSFANVRETKTIDKNSYGTTVVSNVDNATATKMQVFPAWGGVRLVSNSNTLDLANAYIKLPSNLNDIEWVRIYFQSHFSVEADRVNMAQGAFYSFDETRIDELLDAAESNIETQKPDFLEEWQGLRDNLKKDMMSFGYSTLYKGVQINAYDGSYNANGLLIPEIHGHKPNEITNLTQVNLILVENDVKKSLIKTQNGVGYEKGSDKINVDFLSWTNEGNFTNNSKSCDCGYYSKSYGSLDPNTLYYHFNCGGTWSIQAKNMLFAVKYEPMSDLKIKVDNDRETNDIQIYNQNGKLTDSRAFSKLLDSYSKEISSDTITRYMVYYDFDDVPIVGTMVTSGNDFYVINNISLDFNQNEDTSGFGYYITAEVTMSKYVSTKSLMTNPNSNIRDYGIPQKNTVKRKQLYRDYAEFRFLSNSLNNSYYQTLDKTLPFYNLSDEYVRALIRVTFQNSNNYYYQLDTTRYVFKKTQVTMVDFQDNNIIGYDFQNRFSGFNISRILSDNGMTNDTNVPIQYTDDNGKVAQIRLKLLTGSDYSTVVDSYITSQSGDSKYKYVLTSRCFINYGLWQAASDYGLPINETQYYKDPLEIPVFEYMQQIGSSNEVLVCDNIFLPTYDGEIIYLYSFAEVDRGKANEYNGNNFYNTTFTTSNYLISYNNAVVLLYRETGNSQYILLGFFDEYSEWGDGYATPHSVAENKDIVIYRNTFKRVLSGGIYTNVNLGHEPIMVIKPNDDTYFESERTRLRLYPHLYKLK